jgi:branched-chain amino acid aminotransferase
MRRVPPRRRASHAARVPDRAVWIAGRIVRGATATLSVFDRGARDGEGLLETLRVYGGAPFDWDRHMERLVLSAAELGFPVPPAPAVLREALEELLAAESLRDAAARITVTRGIPGGRPTRTGAWIEVEPLGARLWKGTHEGVAHAIVSKRPFHPGPLGRHKTTSRLAYSLAREEARAARADEALLCAEGGELLEGAASNAFIVIRGQVVTPPIERGILPGIVRSRVLEICRSLGIPAREAIVTRATRLEAEEVFLTNSVQEVVPVVQIGERAVAKRDVGLRLREAYRAAVDAGA